MGGVLGWFGLGGRACRPGRNSRSSMDLGLARVDSFPVIGEMAGRGRHTAVAGGHPVGSGLKP